MSNQQNKTVLITGGTSGIGFATAQEFINQGASLVITGRTQATLDKAVERLGRGSAGIVSDAGNLKDIEALPQKLAALHPRIDVLFVNAGYGKFAPIDAVDAAHFDEQFNVLVKGTYFTVKHVLPLMADGGAVILNTSVVTEKGMAGASIYSAAKAAVQSFTKTLASELIGRGIRVNAVSPGPIHTSFFDKTGMTPEQIESLGANVLSLVPMKRFGEASEVAKAVVFLASADASYMMGAELFVDGGMVQV